MLIDFQRKWCFIHVPKCAGTSIEAALKPYADLAVEWPSELWWLERAHNVRGLLLPNQWDNFQTFAVARNPWEWFVSDYRFCRRVWKEESPCEGMFADKVARAARQGFPRFLLTQLSMQAAGVWRHYAYSDEGLPLIQRPVRFDRLADEWPQLMRDLGLPAVDLPRLNVSQRRDWRKQYTPELVAAVAEACAADIAEFGWTF